MDRKELKEVIKKAKEAADKDCNCSYPSQYNATAKAILTYIYEAL